MMMGGGSARVGMSGCGGGFNPFVNQMMPPMMVGGGMGGCGMGGCGMRGPSFGGGSGGGGGGGCSGASKPVPRPDPRHQQTAPMCVRGASSEPGQSEGHRARARTGRRGTCFGSAAVGLR